jgi:excisionase family DNA binding protein
MSQDPNDDKKERPAERYLSTRDIARRLGVSVKTLERWRQTGRQMPAGALLFGNQTIRYPESEVEPWLKQHDASRFKPE